MTGVRATLRTARGPIAYAERGAGPPLLIVHGTPGGEDQGLALATILGLGDHRAVAPSRPGYLGTPLATGRAMEDQADACAALLDALGIGRAAVLSNSGGGPVALQFALRHPDRLARLVLLQSITALLPIATDDLLHAALLLPRASRLTPAVVGLALRRRQPGLIGAALALAGSTLPVAARRAGTMNDALHISSLPPVPFGTIRAPTLLIHGTVDQNVPYEQSVAAARAMPNARLVGVPGGDHSSVIFDRGAIGAIGAFLREG